MSEFQSMLAELKKMQAESNDSLRKGIQEDLSGIRKEVADAKSAATAAQEQSEEALQVARQALSEVQRKPAASTVGSDFSLASQGSKRPFPPVGIRVTAVVGAYPHCL